MKMSFFASVFFAGSFALSTSGFALVLMEAQCTSADGRYEMSVIDNQGTGLDRHSNYSAVIRDIQGSDVVVASYPVAKLRMGSVSFGRLHYIDTATSGKNFDLAGPSTNFRNFELNSLVVNDDNLHCTIFNGSILNPNAP